MQYLYIENSGHIEYDKNLRQYDVISHMSKCMREFMHIFKFFL